MTPKNQIPQSESGFQDWLPVMAGNLGGEGLIGELCNGFNLLMDREKGVINFESLKRNAAALGLGDLSDDELRGMLREGDFDGDGALNQMEFCVLMFRLSPELMEASRYCFHESLRREFRDSFSWFLCMLLIFLGMELMKYTAKLINKFESLFLNI